MTFVSNVWNGKTYSLPKHYFLFLTIPLAILGALEKGIDAISLSDWEPIATYTVIVLELAVVVVGYVGLFNCARHQKWRGWAIVAVVVASVSLLISVARAFVPADDSDIQREVTMINMQLPKTYDNGTFTRASYDTKSHAVTFLYDTNVDVIPDDVKDEMQPDFCPEFKGRYATVRTIRFVYHKPDNAITVVEMTRQDCQ